MNVDAELAAWAEAALAAGREAWPELTGSTGELARFVRAHRAAHERDGELTPLARLDAAELYLACACVRRDPGALRLFRARYYEPVVPTLRRMGLGEAQRDDVWQILCERLLVGVGDEPPRLARYAGTGDLGGLVRVSATRVALNWLEQEKRRESGDDWLEALPARAPDPEQQAMKQQHKDDLKEEIEAAVRGLEARERMLLRLHLVEHLGIDAIAELCGVHRATAARWIASAKEALVARVRGRLGERWAVAEESLAGIKQVIDSQIDLSLERLLAAA